MHDCLNSPLGSDLVVETVEILGGGTVKVEPPVADEVVLVEESSVGTEEAVLGQTSSSVSSADVEDLALSLGVSVVTSVNLAVTDESRLGDLGVDGIVLSGHPGDGGLEHGQGVGGVAGGGVEVAVVAGLGVGVEGGLLLPSLAVGPVVAAVTSQGVATDSQGEG